MDDAKAVHHGGTVVIEDDRITDVGSSAEIAATRHPPGATLIDAGGKAVLPGLVDLHYHTALGKGWSDHLPLWEYLQTCWYPMIRALDHEAAYWAALASYSESRAPGHGQRHVPPAATRWPGRPTRSASGPSCRTTSPTTSTPRHAGRQREGLPGPARPATAGSRCSSASSGCRWPRGTCCATPGRSRTSSAPGSTSTSTSRCRRWRSPRRSSAVGPPSSPTTAGSSGPTASPRTASGCRTPRSP